MGFLIAIDYDNTWSADPELFEFVGKALRKAGANVTILTANPDAEDALKAGSPKSFDDVVVVKKDNETADPDAVNDTAAPAKCDWLEKNGADLFIDNNAQNASQAAQVTNAALFFPYAGKKQLRTLRRELSEMRRGRP